MGDCYFGPQRDDWAELNIQYMCTVVSMVVKLIALQFSCFYRAMHMHRMVILTVDLFVHHSCDLSQNG